MATYPSLEQLNALIQNTLISTLGIEFTEISEDYVKARMPVDGRTRQPLGYLHGGASAALAESLGSVGAALRLDLKKEAPMGLEINANHIRAVQTGYVHGTATPVHIGRRTHVWDIKIVDDAQNLVCVSRLTMMIVEV